MNPTSESRRHAWRVKHDRIMLQGFYFWGYLKKVLTGNVKVYSKQSVSDAFMRKQTRVVQAGYRRTYIL
jgi:hypothetical protein